MERMEFMRRLWDALETLSSEERQDICNDYEEHFRIGNENGKTEEEIAAELGNPEELAASYLEESASKAAQTPPAQGYAAYSQDYPSQPGNQGENKTAVTVVLILLIIFVGIPAVPAVIGIWCALLGVMLGMFAAFIGMMAALFMVPGILLKLGCFFLGLVFLALGLLSVCGLVGGTKLIGKGIKAFFSYCGRIFR